MTQHSAASHRARVRKQEGDALREALELEISRHSNTQRKLADAEWRLREDKHAENTLEWRRMVDELRTDLALSRAAHDISRAEAADGRQLRAELVAMLKRHGIEV